MFLSQRVIEEKGKKGKASWPLEGEGKGGGEYIFCGEKHRP